MIARLEELIPQQIAIIRALPGLGDFLCAVPAFRALRAALPGASVALIGLPVMGSLVNRFSAYLDELVEFPGYPGLPEQPPPIAHLPAFLSAMQARRFDLVLQMHGNGSIVNPLAVLLGARRTAGFFVPGQYCPDRQLFLPYPEDEPEVRRHLRLLEFLGVPVSSETLEFPIGEADELALHALPETRSLRPGEYACVHPGSQSPHRRWSPGQFAAVADQLAAWGLPVVLTGTAGETGLIRAVIDAMKTRPLDLTGRTSLGALAVLLRGARLLVCNDTGVSHLAAALRVPSVVIFTGSDLQRWAPLDRERHRCVATFSPPAGVEGGWGFGSVSTGAVLTQVENLMQKEVTGAVR